MTTRAINEPVPRGVRPFSRHERALVYQYAKNYCIDTVRFTDDGSLILRGHVQYAGGSSDDQQLSVICRSFAQFWWVSLALSDCSKTSAINSRLKRLNGAPGLLPGDAVSLATPIDNCWFGIVAAVTDGEVEVYPVAERPTKNKVNASDATLI